MQPGAPAAAAGLHRGDLLLELDGSKLRTAGDLYRVLDRTSIGRPMELRILRSGDERRLRVVPTELAAAA